MDPTGARQRTRAAAVGAAARSLAAAGGVTLPPTLRLWSLAGGDPPAGAAAPGRPGAGGGETDLASVLEEATSVAERRAAGLHVTPGWVADHLVSLALDGASAIGAVTPAPAGGPAGETAGAPGGEAGFAACDPACGGGAFLLAVARALHARGLPRADVVTGALWGADIDPVGLATAEAALALWSGGAVPPAGRLVVGDPLRAGAEVWPDPPPAGFDLVAGNPPFQSQLGLATARPADDQRRLRSRYGAAVRAYTDTAWLFLLLACELARPGGRAVLVQPDSLVAARDAATVRDEVDRRARVVRLWADERRVFTAAVRVCAPVLEVGGGPGPAARSWPDLMADSLGVPRLHLPTAPRSSRSGAGSSARSAGRPRPSTVPAAAPGAPSRVAELATAIAGFRDEYYGLVPVVREATPADAELGPAGGRGAPLVTAGAVDWGRSGWGQRPLRFAKRRWAAPVVDQRRLAVEGTSAARRWVARTRVPKVVVATQTRVVEVAVDEQGRWVPSIPAIAVAPHRHEDLWRVGAALAAPAATAWLARRAPGAALARGALKVAVGDVADLPLPADGGAWDDATKALEAFADAEPGSAGAVDLFEAYVAAATAAYLSPPGLVDWWRRRFGAAIPTGPVRDGPG